MNTVTAAAPQIRRALAELVARRDLERDVMAAVMREIMAGACDPAQIGALLLGLAAKGETMEEITGAATAMREAVVAIPRRRKPVVDTCGTGGSHVPRRNVSTAVALVLAACGVAVAKHGNRGASSPCGSADVLEALGVDITVDPVRVGECIDELGVGFLFAPALHPAMKHAVGPRKALGFPTIFNVLGPLTNPAGAERQLLGVFDPRRCHALAGALASLGSERVFVVHGFRAGVDAHPLALRGIDDLSTEGASLVVEVHHGRVVEHVLRPADAGLPEVPWAALAGEDAQGNAAALRRLLAGEAGPYRTAVQYSGALALLVAGDESMAELPRLAAQVGETIDSGAAQTLLERLVAKTRGTKAIA